MRIGRVNEADGGGMDRVHPAVSILGRGAGTPKLAIGLPVRNGENFLRDALMSLRRQTMPDYRLVIADNASTDSTPEICREFAAKDPRITVIRHAENIGAARNFNFVFRVTPCRYFKWAAHDDVMEPTYLERCIERLDADPGLVLAHSYTNEIDAMGRITRPFDDQVSLESDRASRRLLASFRIGYPCAVWGVMRREAVERTRLFGSYLGSDWNFVAEMVLQGRLALVPEYLFSVRNHATAYSFGLQRTTKAERLAWFNPRVKTPGIVSAAVSAGRFAQAVVSHPLSPGERAACLWYVARRTEGRLRLAVRRRVRGRHGASAGELVAAAGTRVTRAAAAASAESGT